jgi:hypothetical protein
METKTYNTNNFQHRKLFYMLDSITDESMKLFRRTPAGDEEFIDYDLHRMPDGKLLVAFYRYWDIQTVHSFVAIYGDKEEYVSAIPFERVAQYLNPALDYNNRGIFYFMNSKPIYEDPSSWRCDNTFYGPERYLTAGTKPYYSGWKAEDVLIYEPIINLNGVSNLVYAHVKDDESAKDYFINGDPFPQSAATLSEMFRLITEWAILAEVPFNGTDPIILDAKKFINEIGFNSIFVSDQTNMQVAQYLMGNTNARKRPDDVVATNKYLLDFVKTKMAHMSLAGLLSCYPQYGDVENEILRDIQSAEDEFAEDLSNMFIKGDFLLDDYKDCVPLIPDNYVNGKPFYALRWSVLKQKKDLALSLQNK